MQKFCEIFIVSFIGTGVALGMLLFFCLRDKGCKLVEDWIKARDARLRDARIPVVGRYAGWCARLFDALYAADGEFWFWRSVVCGGTCALLMAGMVIFAQRGPLESARQAKKGIEVATAPNLSKFTPDQIVIAGATKVVGYRRAGTDGMTEIYGPADNSEISIAIRQLQAAYPADFARAVSQRVDRHAINLAVFVDGSPAVPSITRYTGLFQVLLVSAVLDFIGFLTGWIAFARILRSTTWSRVIAGVLTLALASSVIYGVAFLAFSDLLGDRTGLFLRATLALPITTLAFAGALTLAAMGLWSLLRSRDIEEAIAAVSGAAVCTAIGCIAWFGFDVWRLPTDVRMTMTRPATIPLVVASGTGLLTTVTFVLLSMTVGIKILAEISREIIISFNGWARNAGSTYIAAWVTLASALIATIIATLLPS